MKIKMEINELAGDEKMYLLIKLMEDMRGDWSERCKERANKILEIAKELKLDKTIGLAKCYLNHLEELGGSDGRAFRTDWEYGGYENAPLPMIKSFSRELLSAIKSELNYPEYALPGED